MSVMALLLRSSVSRARKGSSCSGKTAMILLFALKTHDGFSKCQKNSHTRPAARAAVAFPRTLPISPKRHKCQTVRRFARRQPATQREAPHAIIPLLFVLMSQALANKLQIDVSSPRVQRPFGFSDVLFCL